MQLDDRLKAALLLFCSNAFMTTAWYGHLRFKKKPRYLLSFGLIIAAVVVAFR